MVEHTLRGNRSTLLAQVVRIVCKVTSVVVLARLVNPFEHGLFAMAASVTYFVMLFRDVGLGTAAVQAPNLSEAQLSAMATAHVILGLILALGTLGFAPLAAWFYGETELIPLLAVMSVSFVLIGGGGYPRAQLARELKFVSLAKIDAAAASIGTIAMILGGLGGAGAYSFAFFLLASEAASTGLALRAYGRRPRFSSDLRSLREFKGMAAHLTSYHAFSWILTQMDTLSLGQMFGPRVLGLYNRPSQLLALGTQHIAAPLTQISLATLSRLGVQSPHFARQLCSTATVIAHLSLPLATLSLAVPQETVLLLLGRQWSDSAVILRLLSVGAAVSTITSVSFAVNVAAGQTHKLLWIVLGSIPPTAIAIAIALPHGAAGVAAGLTVANLALAGPRLWWMLRGSSVGFLDFILSLRGPFVANLAFGVGLVLGRIAAIDASWPFRLGTAGLGGLAGVVLVGAFWPRLRQEGRELLALLPFPQGR